MLQNSLNRKCVSGIWKGRMYRICLRTVNAQKFKNPHVSSVTVFNNDISSLDVSAVITIESRFDGAESLNRKCLSGILAE